MSRRLAVTGAVAALVATLSSCGDDADGGGGQVEDRTLTVLAAASLTESLTQVAEHFEAEHVGVSVELAFGSSATLAQQVVEGAPADVLVTADERAMDAAEDGNAIADGPYPFASNALVLVTPPDDPGDVETITDLRDAAFVTCVPTAPCGDVAAEVLARHDVTAAPASQEVDVKAVLAKVTSGEADAGLVYASDAVAAGDAVRVVEVPGIDLLRTNYFVAALHEAEQLDLGMEFVAALRGDRSRLLLQEAGFHGVVVE